MFYAPLKMFKAIVDQRRLNTTLYDKNVKICFCGKLKIQVVCTMVGTVQLYLSTSKFGG